MKYLTYKQFEMFGEDFMDSPLYEQHINAITEEELHSKSKIAIELTRRDLEIENLKALLSNGGSKYSSLQHDVIVAAVRGYTSHNDDDLMAPKYIASNAQQIGDFFK